MDAQSKHIGNISIPFPILFGIFLLTEIRSESQYLNFRKIVIILGMNFGIKS